MRSICGRRWLPCTPATSADRARSEQFFTRPDAQESDRFPPFISMHVRVIATGQTQREAPCTFHDSDLKSPSANVSLASAVLFTFVSPAVRPDAPNKEAKTFTFEVASMHFPSEPESESLLLPLFCWCLCRIRANSMSFHGGLIAPLQQTTLSP